MIHQFDTEVANIVGILPAILFYNIQHWIQKNEANQKHFHDGRYWTYNSIKAFQMQFSYVSVKQIENALKKLKEADLIMTGNYNTYTRDRTLWYALTDKAFSISPNGEMHFPEKGIPFPHLGEPLPDNKPDNKQQIIKDNIVSSDEATVEPKKIDYKQIAKDFNSTCSCLPNIKTITDKRKRKIKSLLFALEESELYTEMNDSEKLQKIFQLVKESDFLSGRNGKWTGCSFDWIIETSNAIKIIEGNYSKNSKQSGVGSNQTSKNNFNNFPQREYSQDDYADLENKLMNTDYFAIPDS